MSAIRRAVAAQLDGRVAVRAFPRRHCPRMSTILRRERRVLVGQGAVIVIVIIAVIAVLQLTYAWTMKTRAVLR